MWRCVVRVPTDQLMAAAATLVRAEQWDVAAGLMEAAEPDDPAEAAGLALALAEAAVDRDFWRGSRGSAAVLARAEAVLGQSSDPVPAFDLDLLRLQRDYTVALFGSGDGSAPEGGGHQTGELDRLRSGRPRPIAVGLGGRRSGVGWSRTTCAATLPRPPCGTRRRWSTPSAPGTSCWPAGRCGISEITRTPRVISRWRVSIGSGLIWCGRVLVTFRACLPGACSDRKSVV